MSAGKMQTKVQPEKEKQLKATQELISMGKKIYIQMVPSSPIEHASFEN